MFERFTDRARRVVVLATRSPEGVSGQSVEFAAATLERDSVVVGGRSVQSPARVDGWRGTLRAW
jgi:hypothetical protein